MRFHGKITINSDQLEIIARIEAAENKIGDLQRPQVFTKGEEQLQLAKVIARLSDELGEKHNLHQIAFAGYLSAHGHSEIKPSENFQRSLRRKMRSSISQMLKAGKNRIAAKAAKDFLFSVHNKVVSEKRALDVIKL